MGRGTLCTLLPNDLKLAELECKLLKQRFSAGDLHCAIEQLNLLNIVSKFKTDGEGIYSGRIQPEVALPQPRLLEARGL